MGISILKRRKRINKLTQEELKKNLNYNPGTGIFKWKVANNGRIKIGNIAGYKNNDGYIQIKVNKKIYYAQRLAWLYMEGYFPENTMDHIDRNPSNNKWDNLRHVSKTCDVRSRKKFKNNKSGIVGVYLDEKTNKWKVQITNNKKQIYLGIFKEDEFDDAVKVRWKAEVKYNWSNCKSDSSAYNYLKENNLI